MYCKFYHLAFHLEDVSDFPMHMNLNSTWSYLYLELLYVHDYLDKRHVTHFHL